jgi:hypothetical protein
LYEITILIARIAIKCNIAITIENPAKNLIWKISAFISLFNFCPHLKFIIFHNCAHGGTREKSTCFATNVDWFDSVELRYDKQHSHAPWIPIVIDGRVNYPLYSEEAYPKFLCDRMASIVLAIVIAADVIMAPDLPQYAQFHRKFLNRVILGVLPRGKHVKSLVSEYGTYLIMVVNTQCDINLQPFLNILPKGSIVQSRLLSTWEKLRDAMKKQVKKHILTYKLGEIKCQYQIEQGGEYFDNFFYNNILKSIWCVKYSNFKFLLDKGLESTPSWLAKKW